MRTASEIVAHLHSLTDDFFGFCAGVLVPHLDFEDAREFLKPDTKPEEWSSLPKDRESVIGEMREYAAFGWEKIQDHRGISANRTAQKMREWVWLLGDEAINAPYENYGAPILKAVCERYGFPIPDDEATTRMANGEPCRDDCDEGCGR